MPDINLDLNQAGDQRTFDVIPAGTVVSLHLMIKRAGAGEDGWLTTSKGGNSEHLALELTVTEGEYARRKIFTQLTLRGTTAEKTRSLK